jgi:DUF4097 and DUF4098 domain-containing protein YvlB
MTQHHFETPEPVNLYVQIDRGRVDVVAEETTQASVEVTGREAEDVLVEQSGRQINIIGPKRRGGLFGGDSDLVVSVIVPTGSNLESRTGSADLTVQGTIGTCHCKTGSGDIELDHVAGSSQVETGSGDVRIDHIAADLRIKSGSGDVALGRSEGALAVSTGSGDVEIGDSAGPTLVKTGSGDLRIEDAHSDIALSTGSGDLVVESARRGKVTAKGASGDVHVGIPAGIPVWTDITTVSGSISSDLEGAGQPADGADHIELRAKTVSGDIVLKQL